MAKYVCDHCGNLVKNSNAVIRYNHNQRGGGTGIYVYCQVCYEMLYEIGDKK